MAQKIKITYATISADNEALQLAYDQAVGRVKAEWLGGRLGDQVLAIMRGFIAQDPGVGGR